MKVILVGHKKRQGKDTFAEYLIYQLDGKGIRAEQLSFANPMKAIMAESLGVDMETLDAMKNGSEHYRSVLQRFGSGLMKKHFGDTVWRDMAVKEFEKLERDGVDCVIISDFRFPCEYIEGATTINVIRNNECTGTHISETALDGYKYDYTIENTGSLSDLDNMADNMADIIWRDI